MKKIKIGISINECHSPGNRLHHLPISYTPAGYVKAVQKAGGLAMLLPISSKEDAKEYIEQVDKLILTGGQDISPHFYEQETSSLTSEAFLERDLFEIALIEEALLQNKPIFAVCRGMQLLNVTLGGNLYQDISKHSQIQHMQAPTPKEIPTHAIEVEQDSTLHQLYGGQAEVNSFHHQAIDRSSTLLKRIAWSPDGLTEAVENKRHRLLAVQWHPDFAYTDSEQEMAVFSHVVQKL